MVIPESNDRAKDDSLRHEPITPENRSWTKLHPPPLPDLLYSIKHYPNFSIDDNDSNANTSTSNTINVVALNGNKHCSIVDNPKSNALANINNDNLSKFHQRIPQLNLNVSSASASMTQSLTFAPSTMSLNIPHNKKIPDYMRIPNLWNVRIEEDEDIYGRSDGSRDSNGSGSGSISSDWEFL